MKAYPGKLIAIALLAATSISQVEANVTRCNNGLASVGDTKPAVLQKCGAPQYKDSFCRPVTSSGAYVTRSGRTVIPPPPATCEMIDEWTYVPESGQFMTIMRFEAGRLSTITSGDRVP